MKVLLTGSTGQLGQEILISKPKNIHLIAPTRSELDLSNKESCEKFIIEKKPNWVINCAAFTAVDNAENEIKLSKQINSYGPEALLKGLNKINGNLLHISTDFVFNGEQNFPYLENQITSPINHYGYTKALGEKLILNSAENRNNFIILRTSWVISSKGENFVLKMLKLHSEKDYLHVIFDQIGAPTSAKELAKVCWRILDVKNDKKLPPILHWSDSGVTSWYDLSEAIGEIALDLGIINKRAKVYPIRTKEYPSPAIRPKFSLLDLQKTSEHLGLTPNHWRKNLKEILAEYKKFQT